MNGLSDAPREGSRCPFSIVIVGAGFSGTMTAVRLLSLPTDRHLSITLVDDRQRIACGIAYQTDGEGWLLNAPARALSTRQDHPGDFVDYCRRQGHQAEPGDFLPRAWYGGYLAHLLDEAVRTSAGHRMHQCDGQVVALEPDRSGRTTVRLQTGATIAADYVILATGQSTGHAIAMFDDHPPDARVIRNPWDVVRLRDVPDDSHFFLYGSGLTAVDLVHALHRRSTRLRFTLMSRRGLLPQPHRPVTPSLSSEARQALLGAMAARPRHCVAAVRRVIAEHQACDGDWREIIDCLRPMIPQIWMRWSDTDRRAFVRHLAPYWDTHRHRHPPHAAAAMTKLAASGQLTIISGRLDTIDTALDTLQLTIRPRASSATLVIHASYLVNCTGAGSGMAATRNPLFAQLHRDGLATFDWGGLRVDESYRVIPADGRAHPSLSYIGPALKRRYWEATAIPELLAHIDRMIEVIMQRSGHARSNGTLKDVSDRTTSFSRIGP